MIDVEDYKPYFSTIPANMRKKAGFVYFVRNKQLGLIKIGMTINPNKRIKDIRNMSGCDVETLLLIPCVDYKDLEIDLHRAFASDRHEFGEWFNPSEAIRNFININHLDFGVCEENYE